NRRLVGGGKAEPWPPAGPFDVALLRLPKAKDEQEMAVHACLGVLASDGRVIVYGGNEEGIRSAAGMLERLRGGVETLATRGHGRVLAAHRPADPSQLRAPLPAWRTTTTLEIADSRRDWVSYPGIFATNRIDEGTALLIDALPALRAGARVLDYACGSGVIGAGAAHRRRAGALAARRHPANRRATPRPPRPAAVPALRHRRHPSRERPLSRVACRGISDHDRASVHNEDAKDSAAGDRLSPRT